MAVPDISDKLERKYLVQDLLAEPDSDEDGGLNARIELDSDFSDIDENNEFLNSAAAKSKEKNFVDPERDWSKLLANRRSKGNTGPKGVKADYEEARRIIRRQNETKEMQRMEHLKRAGGVTTTEQSVSYAATKGGTAEDEELEEVVKTIKFKRLQELRDISDLPKFGSVFEVTKFEFLDHISLAHPLTFVVIHLYEDYLISCQRLNQLFNKVAVRNPHIKFLRLKATEADQTLSHSALPAILVYRDDKLVNDVKIKLDKEIGQDFGGHTGDEFSKFTEADLEFYLATRYGIKIPGLDINQADKKMEDNSKQPISNEGNLLATDFDRKIYIGSTNDTNEFEGYVKFNTRKQKSEDSDSGDDDWK